jgi:homoserine kinase type II
MARHTNLSDADIAEISAAYELHISTCQPIDGGEANSSFLLHASGEDYVLTFYEQKPFTAVEHLAQMLIHLAQHGFFTNQVIPTSAGRCVSAYQEKPAILKKWIPGVTLREQDQNNYHSIGKAIAELHQIPAPHFLRSEHPYGLKHMPASLGRGLDPEFESWLAGQIEYLQDQFPHHLPRAFIHGDLFDDNLIYHQGKFQAIIDFGDACNYYRAYDLGSVLFGACMVRGTLDFTRARELISSYRENVILQPAELAALQFFTVYAGAAISSWHHQNTYQRQLAGAHLKKYESAAQRTQHLLDIHQSEFNKIL